jgi:ferredoxin
MNAKIDKSGCISCGLCVSTCPDVFRMGEDGIAEVYVDMIPSKDENEAAEAQKSCPVSVITIEQ